MAMTAKPAALATVLVVVVFFLLVQGYLLLTRDRGIGQHNEASTQHQAGAGLRLVEMLRQRGDLDSAPVAPMASAASAASAAASAAASGENVNASVSTVDVTMWPVIHTKAYKHCYLYSGSDTFALSPANYVINDKYKFIYFEIPKVASTAIRTLLHQNVAGGSNTLHRGAWQLSATQLGYFKFTCVRDPLDRFVSNFNFLSVFHAAQLKEDREGSKSEIIASMDQWLVRLAEEGWWNWHLWPQSLYLSHFDGAPRAIDRVFDQSNLQSVADTLHQVVGTPSFEVRKVDPLGGTFTETKKVHPQDLPDATVTMVCIVYLVDYCCFGFPLPPACVEAGLTCEGQRDEFDLLNVHWSGAEHSKGQKAHLYSAEANFLRKFKQSLQGD